MKKLLLLPIIFIGFLGILLLISLGLGKYTANYKIEHFKDKKRPETEVIYNYYTFPGATKQEINKNMVKAISSFINPEAYRVPGMQGDTAAQLEGYVDPSYDSAMTKKGCRIVEVPFVSKVTYTMPQWEQPKNVAPSLVADWENFYTALKTHEKGHADIEIKKFDAVYDVYKNAPTTKTCEELDAWLQAELNKTRKQIEEENKQYEIDTRHGELQGARL